MTSPRNQIPQVTDNQNGSVSLAWPQFTLTAPASYNVYVNGVLNQNVAARAATVAGLTQASYNPQIIAATPNNSLRPQNMPPKGLVTPSGTYVFTIVAVIAGVEKQAISSSPITLQPTGTGLMLVTPMKRLWPFPNSTLD